MENSREEAKQKLSAFVASILNQNTNAALPEKKEHKIVRPKLNSLLEECFYYIGLNSESLLKTGDKLNIAPELCNDLFAFLLKKKLLSKDNMNLILKSSSITTLSLEKYFSLQANALEQIALCSSLEGLSLRSCFNVSDQIVATISQGCPNLVWLDLSNTPKITAAAITSVLSTCKKLQTLVCEKCLGIQGTLQVKSESVVHLRLAGCCKVTKFECECPSLNTLDLSEGKRLREIEWIGESKLTKLSLFRCISLDDNSLFEFLKKAGANLVNVNLFECTQVSGRGIHVASNLEELILSNCDIKDEQLIEIVQNCTKLRAIYMNSCESITDNAMLQLAQFCTNLKSIGFPVKVTDESIMEVAEHCTQLRNVDLTGHSTITNIVPRMFLQHCPQLYSLSLCECVNLTDDCVGIFNDAEELKLLTDPEDIKKQKEVAQQLQNLNLSHVPVTDLALKWIGSKCHCLSAIDLYSNSIVTDEGMALLLKGCGATLKRIYIQSCRMLTDATLRLISEHCKVLEFLDVYGIELITSTGLLQVIDNCITLKELNSSEKLYQAATSYLQTPTMSHRKIHLISSRAADF